MYLWLWRKLPGGKLLKLIQLLALIAVLVAVLFTQVFPYLDAIFTVDPTLG